MAYEDGGGGGGAFAPITYNSSADEAAAKRAAARKFDEWAGLVGSFVSEVNGSLERDGQRVWIGPSSEPFFAELRNYSKKIPGYRNPYLDTAANLRKSAEVLEDPKNRNT
ncbi:hypothetical protein ACIBG8_22800 [Nonomuraea sp. NPDC050556]|uniref:hypothetical protein n=1 Tax=Nonomuraea sp. NPDC050556 TaxID=3364369 RepID=UPI0037A64A21